jgi:hypothetical protein
MNPWQTHVKWLQAYRARCCTGSVVAAQRAQLSWTQEHPSPPSLTVWVLNQHCTSSGLDEQAWNAVGRCSHALAKDANPPHKHAPHKHACMQAIYEQATGWLLLRAWSWALGPSYCTARVSLSHTTT